MVLRQTSYFGNYYKNYDLRSLSLSTAQHPQVDSCKARRMPRSFLVKRRDPNHQRATLRSSGQSSAVMTLCELRQPRRPWDSALESSSTIIHRDHTGICSSLLPKPHTALQPLGSKTSSKRDTFAWFVLDSIERHCVLIS